MTPLTLLDVDQLAPGDRDALAWLVGSYQGFIIAIYADGAMHCLIPTGLEQSFLAHVARDISPAGEVEIVRTERAA